MTSHPDDHEPDDHDRGLAFDLATLLPRRRDAAAARRCRPPGPRRVRCEPKSSTSATTAASTTTAAGHHDRGGRHDDHCGATDGRDRIDWLHRGDPRGDRRAVPGRRLQRRQRAHRERHRAQRHPVELRLVHHGAEGVPTTVKLTVVDARSGHARWPARRSTSGTATATATTRCTRRPPRTRTTCGACRRPTPAVS